MKTHAHSLTHGLYRIDLEFNNNQHLSFLVKQQQTHTGDDDDDDEVGDGDVYKAILPNEMPNLIFDNNGNNH